MVISCKQRSARERASERGAPRAAWYAAQSGVLTIEECHPEALGIEGAHPALNTHAHTRTHARTQERLPPTATAMKTALALALALVLRRGRQTTNAPPIAEPRPRARALAVQQKDSVWYGYWYMVSIQWMYSLDHAM